MRKDTLSVKRGLVKQDHKTVMHYETVLSLGRTGLLTIDHSSESHSCRMPPDVLRLPAPTDSIIIALLKPGGSLHMPTSTHLPTDGFSEHRTGIVRTPCRQYLYRDCWYSVQQTNGSNHDPIACRFIRVASALDQTGHDSTVREHNVVLFYHV
jgi:hypothetical protein